MPRLRSGVSRGWFLCRVVWGAISVVGLGAGAGCVGTVAGNPPMLREPPREVLEATMTHDRLEVADTLELELADGTSAAVRQRVKVLPDGTVELTGCGRVEVAGKTLDEARALIREHVAAARTLAAPLVELRFAQYYVVTESADGQRHVERRPAEDSPTVRDALADVDDIHHKVVWVVRPSPASSIGQQMLAVDWDAIVRGRDDTTNYKLHAGDWVFALDEPARGFGRFMGSLTSMVRENASPATDATADSTAE